MVDISDIYNKADEESVKIYAIKNPDLMKLDDYTKSLYVKILCTVVLYKNNPSAMQILYLRRIMDGLEVDGTLEAHMRRAMDVSKEDILEFISCVEHATMRFYFALEAIILVSMSDSQNNMEYLAEIIELCDVSKEDARYIALVAKSVRLQDSSLFAKARNFITTDTKDMLCTPYISDYYTGTLVDTGGEIIHSAPHLDMDVETYISERYTQRRVVFRNLYIVLRANCCFDGCEYVEFHNCKIISKAPSRFVFDKVSGVLFDDCEISHFTNAGVASFSCTDKVVFVGCFIHDCGRTISGSALQALSTNPRAGLFATDKYVKEFVTDSCKVTNCYISGADMMFGNCEGAVMLVIKPNTKYRITNNEFIDCKCLGCYMEKAMPIMLGEMDERSECSENKVSDVHMVLLSHQCKRF